MCDWLMAHNDGLSRSDRLELPLRASSVEPLSHAAHTLPLPHGSSPSSVASRRPVAGIKTLHSYWSLFLFSSSISRLSSASGSTPPPFPPLPVALQLSLRCPYRSAHFALPPCLTISLMILSTFGAVLLPRWPSEVFC